ncbi:MAG TPA: superoxide dismutase family protein [Mycobacterium sp.]|jgi:Cu-Zn family superoxide dismutase|nr:superoxide dismutase family protein [Mycobacterium sp.]
MPISAPLRLFAAAALIVPVASACSPNEPVATQPGTTPSVWTGSPAPSGTPGKSATEAAPAGEKLTADLKSPDGTTVATADFEFSGGYATITVKTSAPGQLAPGFHGLHVHAAGKCEPNSVAPTGGAPGDFNSAGGHFQVAGHTTHPASGDLTSLQVRGDGSATLVTTTDAFTAADLLAGAKTAIIIHEKPDNFANIPPERYQQINGTPPPDEITMATGDAGKRVACGVISNG